MAFKSTVSDLIKYEPLENPPWRNDKVLPSADQMIEQIIDYQKEWTTLKTKINADQERIKNVQDRFRQIYCDTNTDPLEDDHESKRKQKEQETENLMALLSFFDEKVWDAEKDKELELVGLIEKTILKDGHKIAVKNIKIGVSKPGEFSKNPRVTSYHGEEYYYQQSEDMTKEVDLVLDRFNSLFTDSKQRNNESEKLKSIFKTVAWFLFEILDLHPFGNGNGRLFRAICCYVLQTPFPSPIYYSCNGNNDHSKCSKPCKDDYEQVLIDARKSDTRHPTKLATMLIESCWRTWQKFLKEVQD